MESKEQTQFLLYSTDNGSISVRVIADTEGETMWITQKEMGEIFGVEEHTITYHLKKIYTETFELNREATTRKIRVVRKEGNRDVARDIDFYNLDAVISVGYRVNSVQATQFRIWATGVLRDVILKGYAVKRDIDAEKLNNLQATIRLMSNVLENRELSAHEATALLSVVKDYSYALDTLDDYDHQRVAIGQTTQNSEFIATYDGAMQVIAELGKQFGGNTLFGNQKDSSFHSTISTIYQTFDGIEFYPSVEEKAAMLLYLSIKNHSFSDGNKRIAAALFLWFLHKNGILYKPKGGKIIENNTLVALTLMIAESNPEEMKTMTKVVVALINKNN